MCQHAPFLRVMAGYQGVQFIVPKYFFLIYYANILNASYHLQKLIKGVIIGEN